MGLFGSNDKARPQGGTTIIAEGATVVGELDLYGNLHIDGRVEGRVVSEHDVSIGASGSFEGEIRAARILVSGQVSGRVECGHLEIVKTGKVSGEVASSALVIEPGGQFVGESRTSDEETVKALSHFQESGEAKRNPVKSEAGPAIKAETGTDTKTDAVVGQD